MKRREFVKRIGVAGAALAGGPSLMQILTACGGGTSAQPGSSATPNFAKGGEVHLMQWQSFVPEADKKMQELMTRWASGHKGWSAVLDTVNGNDLQTKTSAAVQSQSGPDVIQMQYNWPWLYSTACADVSDVAGRLIKKQGAFYENIAGNARVKGVWRAVPWTYVPGSWVYRKDVWGPIGKPDFVTTYDDLLTYGKKVAASGKPIGSALGHAYGDATGVWYSVLWAFGGQEVQKDGKTVVLDSDATHKAVSWAIEMWNSGALSHDVLSWDDSSNNRAYAAGKISATLNGASIYISTLPGHDGANPTLQQNTGAAVPLRGPKVQASQQLNMSHAVMKWSKDVGAAKDLVEHLMQKDVYSEWMTAAAGYNSYPNALMDGHEVWKKDPVLKPFNAAVKTSRWPGWPGPPSKQSSRVETQYLIVDMFAKAVQSPGNAKQIVSDTHKALDAIYSQPA